MDPRERRTLLSLSFLTCKMEASMGLLEGSLAKSVCESAL